jgi:uncharacterized membrane protein (DUF485 family)
MNHPAHHEDHPHVVSRNARYGLSLFAVYVLLYAGFIFLAVFRTDALGKPALLGVNLAVVYGFGLIVGAIVLALVYMLLTRRPVHHVREEEGPK